MTGQVLINHKAERVPSYTTFLIKNGELQNVVEFEAKLGDSRSCQLKDEHCSLHVSLYNLLFIISYYE